MAISEGQLEAKKAAKIWENADLRDLLSTAAKSIGAGSPTDAGRSWRLPTEHPDPIVLAGGIPDAPALPVQDMKESLDRALMSEPDEALQYGGWLGFEDLRSVIAQRQSRIEGIALDANNYIIHNGSSGSVDNVSRAFLESGDVVITEAPSFSGTVRAMRGYNAQVIEADMDEHGVIVESVAEAIEKAKSQGNHPKFFYTIADYHNPTGVMLSEQRRADLIRLCSDQQVLIAEDAAYTEIYFGDQPPKSIYAMADGHGVLRLGSLSKNIATGLRIGWVQARPEYIEALATVRFDMGNTPLVQRALADYIESGKLEPHIAEMRDLYAQKCETLCNSLTEHCAPYVRFRKPEGGFFLWVECIGAPASEVANAAAEEGLIFPQGRLFFNDRERAGDTYLRLAFSNASLEHLEEAGKRLKKAFLRVVD